MSRKGRNWSQSLNKAEIRKPALRPAAISGFLLLLLFFSLLSAGSLLASSRGIKAVSRKMPVKPQIKSIPNATMAKQK